MGSGAEQFFKEDTLMANRYMRKCSTSLTRQMETKTPMRYFFTSVRMAIIKNKNKTPTNVVEGKKQRDPLCTDDTATMDNSIVVHKKLNIEQSYDPTIPLLGTHSRPLSLKDIRPSYSCRVIYNIHKRKTI